MQIGGDDLRLGLVKLFKIGDDAAEGGMGLLRFQIADVLADENLVADRKRDGIFQMRANGQNRFSEGGVPRLSDFVLRFGLADVGSPNGIGSGA